MGRGGDKRGGLAVKGACCSCRGFRFHSQYPLEVAITPTPGDLMPSSGFCDYHTHMHKPTLKNTHN